MLTNYIITNNEINILIIAINNVEIIVFAIILNCAYINEKTYILQWTVLISNLDSINRILRLISHK